MHVIARMNVGGPAVEIVELMRGLDPRLVDQVLVTGYCGDGEVDFLELQAPDVEAVRLDSLGRRIRGTDDARALTALRRAIREHRPDIIHTHTAKAGVLGRLAAKTTGTRVIHTHHGHLLYGYYGPVKTRALIHLEHRLARITNRIIAVGDSVKNELVAAGVGHADQYTVIRSGVRLGNLPDKEQARRELGLPSGPVIVSMIGRLTKIKRPDRFADVVKLTRDRGLDVHFLVAGGGDQADMLRDRVQQEDLPVTMLGWRNDLERILAATDIVLLTSDNEGTPLSLMQAALAEVPALATWVGSVPDIVEDGVTGLLCAPSATDIADALRITLLNPNRRIALGRAAQARVIERQSMDTFLQQHTQTYQEVAASRN